MLPLERIPRTLWYINPKNHGIPTISGVFNPINVDDYEKPRRGQRLDEYIAECLNIAPQILEDLPKPRWRTTTVYDFSKARNMRRRRRIHRRRGYYIIGGGYLQGVKVERPKRISEIPGARRC